MAERKLIHKCIGRLAAWGLFNRLSDEKYIKLIYWARMGERLDLNNPKSCNEKLQWLKLYNRKPEYTTMVDKYAVKKYVADIIGEEYIIPTIGVWDKFDDIDFGSLPNQFVLKCTHDSGGLVICKEKSRLDLKAARKKINKSLRTNYYLHAREWPYKDVTRKIIAEKYMSDSDDSGLADYKFYCFHGEVKLVMINSDRNSEEPTKADHFDKDFNWVDLTWGYQHAKLRPIRPAQFDVMVEISEKLSKNIPHVRVDLYCCGDNIYFGELTFFDGSGLDKIEPVEWDYKIGEWLTLPEKNI